MQRFRVDLKTFWAWLCLTNTALLSQSKYLFCLWVHYHIGNDLQYHIAENFGRKKFGEFGDLL